uniref:Copia protein n=1 Tax=Tanacetum cinerariifolium TaxID=118510 RepID=A0A6L2K125_TANCI|nr:copia protein [Tanacetum cinerariifolium]
MENRIEALKLCLKKKKDKGRVKVNGGETILRKIYSVTKVQGKRYQSNLKESHLVAVKRISMYLKGTPNLGLWYSKGSGFDLKAYSESDYARCNMDRKSTSEGCQILGGKLVCWSGKKQSSVAMSSAKAEYVANAGCCAQVLWIKSQMADYDVLYDKVPIICDNTSAIAISNNPMLHSRTKHIDIRYHFIRDYIHFVPIDLQLADIFTMPLAEPSFTRLVAKLEVEEETKIITFLLLWWDKPISFIQDEFISAIGLPICKDVVPLPPKDTVRAELTTLGLFNKDKPTFSSTVLVNSSPLKMKYFSPIWKLFMKYIVKCLDLVHKLPNGKKNKELNICYTRFLSLIFEKLLGRNYASNDLTLVKPHTITTASFQRPLAYEVRLTSHMIKVAKLFAEPEQSLIPPFGETKKKRIPPSSIPKSPSKVLDQHVKEKGKDAGFVVMEEITFEQIVDEVDLKTQGAQENTKSPYDIESEIKIIKSYQAATISGLLFIHQSSSFDQDKYDEEGDASDYLSGLRSMPNDDLASITGFETQDYADHVSEEGTETLHAFADKPAQSDPFGHLHEELCLLHNKVNQLESNITKHVSDSIQATMPKIITNSLKEQLPSLLSDDLKDTLPQLIKAFIKSFVLESIVLNSKTWILCL